MRSLYEILVVSEKATPTEISRAYKKLARIYHPDKCFAATPEEQTQITARFQSIVDAHTRLIDARLRQSYDEIQALRRFNDELEPVEIAGFITSQRKPLSVVFKKNHATVCEKGLPPIEEEAGETDVEAQEKDKSAKKSVPVRDFFEIMQTTGKQDCVIFKEASLNPVFAVGLLQHFLQGHYQNIEYFCVKNYLFNQTEYFIKQNPDRKITAGLYEAVRDIVAMQSEVDLRNQMIPAVQKILHYAQKKAEGMDRAGMTLYFSLFEMPQFRELIRYGFEQKWLANELPDLLSFFYSVMDSVLEQDTAAEKSNYYHLLYNVQKRLHARYLKVEHDPQGLRDLAFDCLDYIHIINADRAVIINQFLLSCALLQKASRLEPSIQVKMADEHIIIQLSLHCMRIARKTEAYMDIYAHQHMSTFIHGLQFNHKHHDKIKTLFTNHLFRLLDLFPYIQDLKSHLNLKHELSKNYLQTYLNVLTAKEQPDYKKSEIHYHAYEAHLKNWSIFDRPEKEQAQRLQTMGHFLTEKGFTFPDMGKNLDRFVMVNRDKDGWLLPGALPFLTGMTVYKSLDGVSIHFETGEISFSRQLCKPTDNQALGTFTDYDMQEIFERSIHSAWFSLDPIDTEQMYHPLQKRLYKPTQLVDSEFLSTLFLADYLLKFFTTGYEIQGKFPYAIRPIEESLIASLPPHLKKIITDFHAQATKQKVHRFWLEADLLPTMESTKSSSLELSYGSLRMQVKKHPMVLDEEGNLKDSKEDLEGWPLYRVPEIASINLKSLQTPAIVFEDKTGQFFFYKPDKGFQLLAITLPEHLQKQLKYQPVNQHFQMVADGNKESACPHFVYQITLLICKKAGMPHQFSAERIFAEEFTAHYQEFALYFPEFARLQQLATIAATAGVLRQVHKQNHKILGKDEANYQSTAHWNQIHAALFQTIKDHEMSALAGIKSNIDTAVVKIRQSHVVRLQEISTMIGSLTPYHNGSAEVMSIWNTHIESVRQDVIKNHGAAAWTQASATTQSMAVSEIPKIVQQLNASLPTKRSNYKNQLIALFTFAPVAHIDAFLNGNHVFLLETLVAHSKDEMIQDLGKQFASHGCPEEFRQLCNGNPEPMARKIAEKKSLLFLQESKINLAQNIENRKRLKAHFETLKISLKKPKELQISATCCDYVPASVYHNSSHMVYGGCRISVSLQTSAEARRHISNLQFPTSSVFYNAASQHISSAKNFVSDLRRQISQLPLALGISTLFSVNAVADDVDRAIFRAEVQQSQAPKDYGFRHTTTPDMAIYDIFLGNIHKSGYKIFPHDSIPCSILKAEANNIIKDEQIEGGFTNGIRQLRAAKSLKDIVEEIPKVCSPATAEDLQKMANKSSKPFWTLTPRDINHFIWGSPDKQKAPKKEEPQPEKYRFHRLF